jgi:4-hydroxy-tetrahydrodipicolinate synthase
LNVIGTEAKLFGRVLTAMVTPFTDDLAVDYKAVGNIVEHLLSTGTDSIVIVGTTGESPTLEAEEKHELLKAVIKHANGKAKVIIGTGSYSTAQTIKASRQAEELGADGLLVVAPYYNKPNQAGLLAHYSAVLSATKLPVIAYNIPGRTGTNISVDTTVTLSNRFANLYALKDSTGSVDQAGEIAGKLNNNFLIYSGDDNLTLPYLSVGACGVISVASHLVGKGVADMVNAYFKGDINKSRSLHYQNLPLFKALFAIPNPALVKWGLASLGLCKPHVRLPLVGPNAEEAKTFEAIMKQVSVAQGKSQVSLSTQAASSRL